MSGKRDQRYGLGLTAAVRGLGAPLWAETALFTHWHTLAKLAGMEAMPVVQRPEILTGTKRGHRKLVKHAFDEALPELGCGAYGCVFPTHEPGVVLKLTTDMDEAFFAANAMTFGEWPLGIVAYQRAIELPPGPVRGDHTYALWRDEAFEPGFIGRATQPLTRGEITTLRLTETFRTACSQTSWLLGEFKDAAQNAYQAYTRIRTDPTMQDPWFEAADMDAVYADGWREWAVEVCDEDHRKAIYEELEALRGVKLLRASLAVCLELADKLRHANEVSMPLGEALDFYLGAGLLLCDVHTGNVGRTADGESIIFDPGQAVPLRPELAVAQMEEITD